MIGLLARWYPQIVVCHIPNGAILSGLICKLLGAERGAVVMARIAKFLKAQGMLPGMPDLRLDAPGGRGLYVEVKRADGTVSPEQRDVHARMRANGHVVWVCRSVGDLERKLRGWVEKWL